MSDFFGSYWFYAAAAGVVVVAYFFFGKKIGSEDYSHKRTDEQEQKMATVTPPRKGDYTPQQLLEHDGRDPSKAVLLSLFSTRLLHS